MPDNSIYNESELLLKIAEGDETAFRKIYDAFYPDLYYFSESLIANSNQSEDIVVVAFTHLWDRREKFAAMQSLKGFLYITVKNSCLKYLQQQNTRARHQEMILQYLHINDEDFVETKIIASEAIRLIHLRIKELSPKYQDVIQLLFIEELSIAEAAERLQITPENLRKRKERALSLLRLRLIKDSIHPLMWISLLAIPHS